MNSVFLQKQDVTNLITPCTQATCISKSPDTNPFHQEKNCKTQNLEIHSLSLLRLTYASKRFRLYNTGAVNVQYNVSGNLICFHFRGGGGVFHLH